MQIISSAIMIALAIFSILTVNTTINIVLNVSNKPFLTFTDQLASRILRRGLFCFSIISLLYYGNCYWNGSKRNTFTIVQLMIRLIVFYLQNDEVYDSVLMTKWYLLPTNCKRMFIAFILKCQYPNAISFATIAPLNVEIFLSVRSFLFCAKQKLLFFFRLP